MEIFVWLGQTGLSTWIRESPSLFAYPIIISLHTVGMGFLVGTNLMIDLRILGFSSRLPLAPMERFFPVMYLGFWVNAASGILLLLAYPVEGVTNWTFYFKLGFIALAMVAMRLLQNQVFCDPRRDDSSMPWWRKDKNLAGASLVFWILAIVKGRYMSYIGYGLPE